MSETIVVISDIQCPYHDKAAVASVLDYIKGLKPDRVCNVGDEIDCPQPSRWNKGFAGEYAGDLRKHIAINKEMQAAFQKAARGNYEIMRSNHVDRIEKYIAKYAPAFAELPELQIETLLGYDDLGIKYHRKIADIAPGWVLAHGDEGSMILSPGGTALSLARKVGKSVVCGHTHRAGIQHDHDSHNGRTTRRLFGMEVGNLMDMRKASYLAYGGANW